MGNFEKLVVLTVLFLVATILGISMQEDSSSGSTDPLGKVGTENVAEMPAVSDTGKPSLSGIVDVGNKETDKTGKSGAPKNGGDNQRNPSAAASNGKSGDSELGSKNSAEKPKVEKRVEEKAAKPNLPGAAKPLVDADGRQTILITTEGLTKPLVGDEYMLYTFQQGDSITVLANRFFGDRSFRANLRAANEGVSFVPGAPIMIPKFDFAAEAGKREVLQPAPDRKAPSLASNNTKPAALGKTTDYTVLDGDSLWKIAEASYGKGILWGEIFKANRDQMSDENDIKVGMVLRIPAL